MDPRALAQQEVDALRVSVLGGAGFAVPDVGGASVSPAAVASPCMAGKSSSFVQKWMIDSGCGHGLIFGPEAKRYPARAPFKGSPMVFATANGKIPTQQKIAVRIEEFDKIGGNKGRRKGGGKGIGKFKSNKDYDSPVEMSATLGFYPSY